MVKELVSKKQLGKLRSDEAAMLRRYATIISGDAPPVPRNALQVLFRAACRPDHAGRAARYFLFWLDGDSPPEVPNQAGANALMDLGEKQQEAMFETLAWWLKPGKNAESLLTIQDKIRGRFTE